ncbi:MAG: MCE family protein [Nitrospirae bacterium]|nr:MCE family protein [Nitrospirota bacterium]
MKGFTTELKVGAFVLAALVAAGFMTMKTGKTFWYKKAGYNVYTYFSDISGLDKKTKVKIAGVDVGVIEDITLEGDRAKVKIRLNPEVIIYEDAVAGIKATGLMGDKALEIQPGSSGNVIKEGGFIRNNKESFDMDNLALKMGTLADGLQNLISNVNSLVGSEDTKKMVLEILKNVSELTTNLKTVISSNDQRFGDTLKSINELSNSVNQLLHDEKGDINQTIANLRDVSKALKEFSDKNAQKLNTITDNADKTLTSVSKMTDKIEKGQGTLGKMVNDDTLYNSINNTAKKVEEMVQKVDRVQTFVGLRGEYLTNPNSYRGNFDVTLMPNPDKYYILGVASSPVGIVSTTQKNVTTTSGQVFGFTERSVEQKFTFNAQFARKYNDTVLRFGLTENTFGLGADQFILNNNVKLSADIWDFGNTEVNSSYPHIKLGADYFFYKKFFVTVGADNLLNHSWSGAFIGGGFTLEDSDLKYLFGVLPRISP